MGKDLEADVSGLFFRPGENCWRVERADRFSFIVDADDYFRALRKVCIQTERELLLIGWDFDLELEMVPGESDDDGKAPDGFPNQLGAFLEAIVERAPDLNVYILKWNGAVLAAPGRLIPSMGLFAFGSDRIHFALDGHHPFGACHHQKIVVADGAFGFCGGIDVTENRWDTSEHLPDDPRRLRKDGSPSEPWHDATSAMTGPAASALAELSRRRWHRATGEEPPEPPQAGSELWPEDVEVDATDVEIAIARTEPPYDQEPLVNEIEQLFLDSIAAAQETIYIESQYLTAETICEALAERLREDDAPEVIIINPEQAESEFEDEAMNVLRGRMIERLKTADQRDRFRIYHPVTSAGEPIYVHAKIMIVDDKLLHIGSSNLNDRSMGFDTECDIAIEGPADLVTRFRGRLVSEHLGVSADVFDQALKGKGSVIAAIEHLNENSGRGLRRIERMKEGIIGKFLANTRLLDQRYMHRQESSAGQGLRPRHLGFIAGGTVLAFIAWKIWQRAKR